MKLLLTVAAALETGAGVGLLVAPAGFARLLLGGAIEGPVALTVARMGGAALLAIGIACWRARMRGGQPLVVALLGYNLAAVAILVHAALGLALSGVGLWPTVCLHAALAGWSVVSCRSGAEQRNASAQTRSP